MDRSVADAAAGARGTATLCATATVALRWWPAGDEDMARSETECGAGLRALEACLEADGRGEPASAAGRLEAKLDLLLVSLQRIDDALAARSAPDGRALHRPIEVLLRAGSIEWTEPAPPPDGTEVVVDLRAAVGQPVSARLLASLSRVAAPAGAAGLALAGGVRVVATLAPMTTPLQDAYERCVFILHRRSLRRAQGAAGRDAVQPPR